MRVPQSGLQLDNPAWPLLQALISYWGVTDVDGAGGGTNIRCGALALEPSYANHALKILSGPAAGQIRDTTTHPAGTDTVTVVEAFSNVAGAPQQITTGTLFVILSKTPAIAEVAAVLASLGLMADAATADDLSNVTTTSAHAKLRRLLLRMSGAGIFSADIQGLARTELDTMLAQLAIYFNAAGAALAVTMNPGAGARASLQLILQDLADMLAGATGIVTFPTPRALPANGVSMAEVERYIAELKPHFSTPTALTHTTASAAPAEDTVFTTAAIGPGQLHAIIFPNALVAGDDITFRVYQWDTVSAAYQLLSEQQFVGAQTNKVYTIGGLYIDDIAHIQVRTLRTSATNRSFGTRRSIYQQPVA